MWCQQWRIEQVYKLLDSRIFLQYEILNRMMNYWTVVYFCSINYQTSLKLCTITLYRLHRSYRYFCRILKMSQVNHVSLVLYIIFIRSQVNMKWVVVPCLILKQQLKLWLVLNSWVAPILVLFNKSVSYLFYTFQTPCKFQRVKFCLIIRTIR